MKRSAVYNLISRKLLLALGLTVLAGAAGIFALRTSAQIACEPSTSLVEGFESGTLGIFTPATVTCDPAESRNSKKGGGITPEATVDPNPCGAWTAIDSDAYNGEFSAYVPDSNYRADQTLTLTDPVAIPANASASTLSFYHKYQFEYGGVPEICIEKPAKTSAKHPAKAAKKSPVKNLSCANFYDGGVLEVSVDGGSFNDAGSNITSGGYTGTLTESDNPLQGRSAWVGFNDESWDHVTVNMLPYAGHNVQFRFREGTDSVGSSEGWWVDDISLTTTIGCEGICNNYDQITDMGNSIVPGDTDTGNHCDDCTTSITLPFAFPFNSSLNTTANVSSNGNLQFTSDESDTSTDCLPNSSVDNVLSPYWNDLRTDGPGEGIFTSVSGTAPNRVFNIEWRAEYYGEFSDRPALVSHPLNFEIRLFEATGQIDFVYGNILGNDDPSTTIGIQLGDGSGPNSVHTYACDADVLQSGLRVSYVPACNHGSGISGSKVISGGTLVPGGTVQYTINLTNNGVTPQRDNPYYEFVDVLPSQLVFLSATSNSGLINDTTIGNGFGWNGSIDIGQTITIVVNANVKTDTVGQTIANQGLIFSDPDNDGINDTIGITDDPATEAANDATVFRTAQTISGNVQQFNGANPPTNLQGVTIDLTGTANASTTTDANGNFTFTGLPNPGTYTLTPAMTGKTFDPVSRTFTNQSGNLSGVNFLAYNSNAIPRTVSIQPTVVYPGNVIDVPIVMNSQGNETALSFSFNYDTNPFMSTPVAVCGSSDPNCTITYDNTTPGRIGVTVTNPTAFNAGPREVARIRLQSLPTSLPSTPVTFGGSPVGQQVTDAANNTLPTIYSDSLVVFAAGIEGDVATRPTGDTHLLTNDLTTERQIIAGVFTPDPATNEFQRADTFPIETRGDGKLDVRDIIQERRYVAGLDLPWIASGPNGPIQPDLGPIAPAGDAGAVRTARAGSVPGIRGQRVTVPIELTAQGNEVGMAFTLSFDPAKLSNPTIELGSEASEGTVITANTLQANVGRVAIVLDSDRPWSGPSTPRNIVNVTFDVAPGAADGSTGILFSDSVALSTVADAEGNLLPARFEAGSVNIGSASAGVELSGRVVNAAGSGIRGAQITIVDSRGNAQKVMSSSLGYYHFDGLSSGETYVLKASSRGYRFAARTVQVDGSLVDVDLVGRE